MAPPPEAAPSSEVAPAPEPAIAEPAPAVESSASNVEAQLTLNQLQDIPAECFADEVAAPAATVPEPAVSHPEPPATPDVIRAEDAATPKTVEIY